jgi:pimeloyl-ACP methyl ester carboxylesterase
MRFVRFGPADAPPVLLLHGGGVAGWMWDSLRKRLEPDHRVLVPDLPGHGSSSDEPYRSHAQTTESLAALVAAEVSEPVAVVGFSLGAQLTILLAADHADLIRSAMVVSAQARPAAFTGVTLRALSAAAPLARRRWFARLQARELFIPPDLLEDYIETSASITRPTLVAAVGENMRFRLPEGWSRFSGHALVMVGGRERALMRESASIIHAALPTSEREVVAGCGHGIPLQRPDWFGDRVSRWLSADAHHRPAG